MVAADGVMRYRRPNVEVRAFHVERGGVDGFADVADPPDHEREDRAWSSEAAGDRRERRCSYHQRPMNLDLPPPTTIALERFATAVAESPHNLVSRAARAELRTRHVPESVALARLLPAGEGRLLDLGSGGGLPGMVIALVRPDLEVHLLDSTAKKTRFLEQVADELRVAVSVHTGRAEQLSTSPLGGTFDVVTARAVASLDTLIGWAMPFLRPGGALYAVKGERWAEELEAASPVLRRTGARVLATPDDVAVDEPGDPTPRVVIIGRAR